MFEYLDRHKEEQEEKNNFLPTVQLKLKNRNGYNIMNQSRFIIFRKKTPSSATQEGDEFRV